MCVTHTQEHTTVSPFVFLSCCLLTSSTTNFSAFTQANSSNLCKAPFPGAGAGVQCCRPPPLPSSSPLGKGPAWLPWPFLQAGLVCSPQAVDGLAAAYSKSE